MKCINKKLFTFGIVLMASLFSACGEQEIKMPFSDFQIEEVDISTTFSKANALTKGFAEDYIVFNEDDTSSFQFSYAKAGILADLTNQDILFSYNSFDKRYPASITKIMTCLVALQRCSLDEVITVTDEVYNISDPTAVKLGIAPGDTMTLDQALHLCLISSYNDVAVAIACHVGGSEEEFCNIMNEEAKNLGATGTHFTDSCGLGSEEHYTSVYDLYLIFNEAIKYPEFLEIIQNTEYETIYHDRNNNDIVGRAVTTNRFFRGDFNVPGTVNIVGGKTGTTDDAGYCLMLLVKDTYSHPYIALVLGADSLEDLYSDMTALLSQIPN